MRRMPVPLLHGITDTASLLCGVASPKTGLANLEKQLSRNGTDDRLLPSLRCIPSGF